MRIDNYARQPTSLILHNPWIYIPLTETKHLFKKERVFTVPSQRKHNFYDLISSNIHAIRHFHCQNTPTPSP